MNYEGLFTVAGPGHRSGLEILSKSKAIVSIKSYSSNHIDTEINLENVNKWRMTCFYRYAERTRRKNSWNFLIFLSHQSPLSWVVIGDFNDILRTSDKKGQPLHPNWMINGFRVALSDSGLSDLTMEGHIFTWKKSRGTSRWVEERLDRACATPEWVNMFSASKLTNLIAHISDHFVIHLQISVWRQIPRGFRFHFENSRLREEGCSNVVDKVWKQIISHKFYENMDKCARELRSWGQKPGMNFKDKIA